jgi:hypothetical protein
MILYWLLALCSGHSQVKLGLLLHHDPLKLHNSPDRFEKALWTAKAVLGYRRAEIVRRILGIAGRAR